MALPAFSLTLMALVVLIEVRPWYTPQYAIQPLGMILSGTPPLEAVKYQIMILMLIATATGMGAMLAIELGARRLFDERQRLRLDRLAQS